MLARCALILTALVLVAGGIAGGGASADLSPPVAGSAGAGDPYFPEDGNGGIDVRSYDVHDGYRFADGRLRGWTSVTLVATEPLTSFDLDLLLPVTDVRLSTGPASYSRPDRHELRIHPATPIPAGTRVRATIGYAGHPARIGWDDEHNWLADRHEVVAMNEPHMAAWWFPADDHPSDKATVDLHLRVPRDRQVVANGHLVGVRRAAGHATYHWTSGAPMASYLAFFAAGRFVVRQGTHAGLPWYVAVSRRLPAAQRHAAMQSVLRTPLAVAWLQHVLGPYPFGETGGVVTSLHPGFALENQTRPTYPGVPTEQLMVHELAHQWFGDSVSLRDWRDVWLNEGFATFMEHLWVADHGGESVHTWLEQAYADTPADDPFWSLPVADPGPKRLFAWPVYQRGAMTLAALRQRIGPATFHRLLRTWVRDHAHGHGTTAEFESLAARLSGQQLTAFFDAWLRTPAKPADGL